MESPEQEPRMGAGATSPTILLKALTPGCCSLHTTLFLPFHSAAPNYLLPSLLVLPPIFR